MGSHADDLATETRGSVDDCLGRFLGFDDDHIGRDASQLSIRWNEREQSELSIGAQLGLERHRHPFGVTWTYNSEPAPRAMAYAWATARSPSSERSVGAKME